MCRAEIFAGIEVVWFVASKELHLHITNSIALQHHHKTKTVHRWSLPVSAHSCVDHGAATATILVRNSRPDMLQALELKMDMCLSVQSFGVESVTGPLLSIFVTLSIVITSQERLIRELAESSGGAARMGWCCYAFVVIWEIVQILVSMYSQTAGRLSIIRFAEHHTIPCTSLRTHHSCILPMHARGDRRLTSVLNTFLETTA